MKVIQATVTIMTPEEVMARFVAAIRYFPPITRRPSDKDLKQIKDTIEIRIGGMVQKVKLLEILE